MAHETHFGNKDGKLLTCDVCEAMCLDAVDGTLTPAEHAAFELHVAGCAACAEQFAEAQRGAAWMELLKTHKPEPSSALLANILALTAGAEANALSLTANQAANLQPATVTPPQPFLVPTVSLPSIVAAPVVAGGGGKLLQFRRKFAASVSFGNGAQTYFQPRLAMTAAMAFFSVAMTMNLTGTRLSDLRPGALHRTVADARANAVRSFQGLRVVYQVEAKVSELRRDDARDTRIEDDRPRQAPEETAPVPETVPAPKQAAPEAPAEKKPAPNGTSQLQTPAPHFLLTSVSESEQQVSKHSAANDTLRTDETSFLPTATEPKQRQKGA